MTAAIVAVLVVLGVPLLVVVGVVVAWLRSRHGGSAERPTYSVAPPVRTRLYSARRETL